MSLKRLLLVILCGGLGSGARYLFGGWVLALLGPKFPFGTIAINAIGSFLIAAIMYVSLNSDLIGGDTRVALTTGVMGGFTTYSTFNYESIQLFQQGSTLFGILNIVVTVLLCLMAGWAGVMSGRLFVGS